MKHLKDNMQLTLCQHGFLHAQQILQSTVILMTSQSYDNGKQTDAKAFDTTG